MLAPENENQSQHQHKNQHPNPDLADEITSINAIYPDSLTAGTDHYTLALPSIAVSLKLAFPDDYPHAPPTILGSAASGPSLKRGRASEVVEAARATLGHVFQPGEPCVFDVLQELEARVADGGDDDDDDGDGDGGSGGGDASAEDKDDEATFLAMSPPPWALSEPVVEKKSVFVARAARVRDRDEAQLFLRHLLATDKKAARATHNISAWRMRVQVQGRGGGSGGGGQEVVVQDCDDDGEAAAGGRLLHLLQLMDAWGVMVVVSRWYGGVHLGPDRFRLINACAREAVVKCLADGGDG